MPLPFILAAVAAVGAAAAIGAALSDEDDSSNSYSREDIERELQRKRKEREREAKAELAKRQAEEKRKSIKDRVAKKVDTNEEVLRGLIGPYVNIEEFGASSKDLRLGSLGVVARASSEIGVFSYLLHKNTLEAKQRISNIPAKHDEIRELFNIWDIKSEDFATAMLTFQELYKVEVKPKQAFLDTQEYIKQAEQELQRLETTIEQLGKKPNSNQRKG